MKILFATDGEKQGEAALEMVQRFDLGEGDQVKIVSVVDMAVPMAFDVYGESLPDTTSIERTARANAGNLLDAAAEKLRSQFPDVEISTDVLFGSPDSRIVEAAEEMRPDLVVVGSHGYSRWERLLLGSVSDSVVHHAPCSVLVVRTPKG